MANIVRYGGLEFNMDNPSHRRIVENRIKKETKRYPSADLRGGGGIVAFKDENGVWIKGGPKRNATPKGYGAEIKTTYEDPDSESDSGKKPPQKSDTGSDPRSSTRTSSTGVKQTGTSMASRVATDAELKAFRPGVVDVGTFTSEALPGSTQGEQQINPMAYVPDRSDLDQLSMEITQGTGGKYIKGYKGDMRSVDGSMLAYAINNQGYQPNSTRQVSKGEQQGTSTDADKGDQTRQIPMPNRNAGWVDGFGPDGDEYDLSEFGGTIDSGKSWKDSKADLAFLNAKNSADGLRGLEDSRGYIRQGGKTFALVNGEYNQVNDEGYELLKNRQATAENLKNTFVSKLTGKTAGGNTKPTESTPNPSAVQQPVEKDKATASPNIGPWADGAKYANQITAVKGTSGIGPYADGDVFADVLEDWNKANTNPGEN